ncbi:MAG: FMN-binding negative transcriptional regulator [Ferruginibacter sp.]
MYKFSYFTENNPDEVLRFMKEYPFAIITAFGDEYPVATHIPLEIVTSAEGKIFLSGHIMRKTDHHKAFEKNSNVLVVFNGPHTYISASWYTNPQTASTWNYMTVHAKGKITLLDEAATYDAVKKITEKYEGGNSTASFESLGDAYVNSMVKAIIAFTIEVESIDNVFKLSQNRDEASKKKIIEALLQRPDDDSKKIAAEIQKRLQS